MKKYAVAAALLVMSAAPAFSTGDHTAGHYTFGEPGKAVEATHTVNVALFDEMEIAHDLKQVEKGETIRFVVTNKGQSLHEFSLGDTASQRAHAAMMKKMPDMKHENDPAAVTLAPGETKEVIWKFSKPIRGQLEFACQIPGHYDAGMTSKVAFANNP
jgi:uncharacterized cupredoxin-like copper-binding protein